MEPWYIFMVSLFIALLVKTIFNIFSKPTLCTLPPGPTPLPIIGNVHLLLRSPTDLFRFVKTLHAKYGPVLTLYIGSRPNVFVSTPTLAHEALIHQGIAFSGRPPILPPIKFSHRNKEVVSSAMYGRTWRHLRSNLTSNFLSHSRIKSYSHARKWALGVLIQNLQRHSSAEASPIPVKDHVKYMMFCLVVCMCFGDKINDQRIKKLIDIQEVLLDLSFSPLLNFWPSWLGKILFFMKWRTLAKFCQEQDNILLPLFESRKKLTVTKEQGRLEGSFVPYVETLLDMQVTEADGSCTKLEEVHVNSLCSEFVVSSTHSTSATLQWIMANLVKYQHIQDKLYSEIKTVVSFGAEEVKEEDLQKIPYLRAVVLEGLRRHPLGKFILPHAVTEDTKLNGYTIPKDSTAVFVMGEVSLDPEVWEDPLQFKPERFISDDGEAIFDITGSKEIKMMPFGVGRRMCPGYGLAMLHLEYFVGNMIWHFKWMPVDGDQVDLTEKLQLMILEMKHPLKANILPRSRN